MLYVNQEMVLRLGAVTGVGHARLILERFGRFWGAFSVIDLFLLNALTIITEFIGITLAAGYLGVPKVVAVGAGGAGHHRLGDDRQLPQVRADRDGVLRRIAAADPGLPAVAPGQRPDGQLASPMPQLPGGSGQLGTVMLLIIGIVGTTVAPWQLFFQQSYVIDKRITPRFIPYEKADLVIGIGIVDHRRRGDHGRDGGRVRRARTRPATSPTRPASPPGLSAYAGKAAGALFAVALLDAAMIGAFAVSLSTAYALGDVLGLKHSLHRGIKHAKGFYVMYGALIAGAAAIVLIPGSPLGLFTEGVQVLAGVLLPSATVFLLMLCNDKAVLGPWVNGRATNAFAAAVIARPHHAVADPDRVCCRPAPDRQPDHRDHGGLRGPGGRHRRRAAGARPAGPRPAGPRPAAIGDAVSPPPRWRPPGRAQSGCPARPVCRRCGLASMRRSPPR